MKRGQLIAAKFVAAGTIATGALAVPPVAEPSGPCQQQYEYDLGACADARDAYLNSPDYSWWTGTCNLEYVACTLAADLLLAVCLAESFVS